MRYRHGTILSAVLAILLPATALADGGFVAPWISEIYEDGQLAFIHHDAAEQRESLHIVPKFYGDASEFAWIVPLPSLPAVEASDLGIFRDAERLSQPVYRDREGGFDCERQYDVYDVLPGEDNGVQIISEDLVGIYQTMILSADDASVLTDSLSTWGFLPPGGDTDFTAVLDHYVSRNWYFVTMRVDTTAIGELGPYQDYYQGAVQPIEFTFDTEQIVYPLRISSISAAPQSDVLLYVAAGHRTTFDGAVTRYANRIDGDEMDVLNRRHPYLRDYLSAGDFLTKLSRTFTPDQMLDDLILTAAASNEEYREIRYSGMPVTLGLFATPSAAWLVWRVRRSGNAARRRRSRRSDR